MDYLEPLVIPPHTLPHRQTFILLHGRGSSGEQFGPTLLESPISASTASPTALTLALAFPHARFVFPTAPRRRATVYRRALTRQWFNNWKLDPPATDREELQVPGLCETTAYLHGLWRSEIAAVPGGASNVVVGGLSQGCAATLVALLLWEGDAPAAMFGMCGWLPFAARLNEQLSSAPYHQSEGQSLDDPFDPFQRDEGDDVAALDPPTRAMTWLREELALDPAVSSIRGIPIFLGHGTEDDRVSIVLGRDSSSCLSGCGAEVCWNEYESLAHWYSGDMLRDIVQFIKAKTKWEGS